MACRVVAEEVGEEVGFCVYFDYRAKQYWILHVSQKGVKDDYKVLGLSNLKDGSAIFWN